MVPLRRSGAETEHPDNTLATRAAAGDRVAFNTIYERYVRKVYNLVFKMLHGAPECEELTQEVFLQVYRGLPRFQGKSDLFTWIYRVASNTCYGYLKHERVRERAQTSFACTLAGRVSESAELRAERRELIAGAVEGLEHLPPLQRTVMILGPIQGHHHSQVAKVLGVSMDVVKGQMHRARVALRRRLGTPVRAAA